MAIPNTSTKLIINIYKRLTEVNSLPDQAINKQTNH